MLVYSHYLQTLCSDCKQLQVWSHIEYWIDMDIWFKIVLIVL